LGKAKVNIIKFNKNDMGKEVKKVMKKYNRRKYELIFWLPGRWYVFEK